MMEFWGLKFRMEMIGPSVFQNIIPVFQHSNLPVPEFELVICDWILIDNAKSKGM